MKYVHSQYQSATPEQKLSLRVIITAVIFALLLTVGMGVATEAKKNNDDTTTVPGHTEKYDADGNGIPDEGQYVNGHYTSVYTYDANGDFYWDLGDGRVQGTVGSVEELNQETLTVCDYVVNYRGDFNNDPFMDAGWIQNHINCSGYDDNGTYNYLIVHESDPRYTGNPEWATFGGGWEYHVLTQSGSGNLVKVQPQNNL